MRVRARSFPHKQRAKQAVLAARLDGASNYRLEIEKENEAKVFFFA